MGAAIAADDIVINEAIRNTFAVLNQIPRSKPLTLFCGAGGGLGYSGGYNDGKGLGAWRAENHLETDVWDVSHPSKIVYPDGTHKEHWHRIQPVSLTANLNGETSSGMGSMTLTIAGKLPQHLQLQSQ